MSPSPNGQLTSPNPRHQEVRDILAILGPVLAILLPAAHIISVCPVEQQDEEEGPIEVGREEAWMCERHAPQKCGQNFKDVVHLAAHTPPAREQQLAAVLLAILSLVACDDVLGLFAVDFHLAVLGPELLALDVHPVVEVDGQHPGGKD